MQRHQLAPGHGTQLVAQQAANVVVGLKRLGHVPARVQRRDQRHPGGLPEPRRRDHRPRELHGQGWIDRPRRVRRQLHGLDPQVLERGPLIVQPRRLEARQQPRLDEPRGLLGERQALFRRIAVACAGERFMRRLDVDPDRLGQCQHDAVPCLDRGRRQCAP